MDAKLKHLENLAPLFGPSGCEDAVADYIRAAATPFADDMTTDQMGNVLALYTAAGEPCGTLMLSAHMDEVGFMVSRIEENGYVRFSNIGGIDARVLPGRTVVFENGVRGVIGCKPIHLQEKDERKKTVPQKKLYIDIGATDKAEAEALVSLGMFATFTETPFTLGGGRKLAGKALDDRAGCAILLDVLEQLATANTRYDYDIVFAFTVREEVGLSGATVAANYLKPDIAIVLETTAIADIAETPEELTVAWQGKGGAISLADRSTIYDAELVSFVLKTGEEANIPVQVKRYLSGGNDAGSIHRTGVGVRCLALSLPTRYLHTATGVIDVADYHAVRDLLSAMLARLEIKK